MQVDVKYENCVSANSLIPDCISLLNGAWIDAPFICHFGEQFLRNVGSCVCERNAETAA